MYNWSYIHDFLKKDSKENIYLKYLRDPRLLDELGKKYLEKYGPEANAYYLALKESLDHYVAMKIAQNKGFVESKEFTNYSTYLKKIIQQNTQKINGNSLYIEPNINIVFNYLDEKTIEKIYPNNTLKKHMNYNQKILDSIFEKLTRDEKVSKEELSLVSVYLDNKKEFKSKTYEGFIEYVFKHLDSITSTPELVSSILTFLPRYYKEGVENSRTFLGKKDGNKNINWAHSSGSYAYTCFEYDRFHNIKLNSFISVNSSRSYKKTDIIFLLFVEFHELSHQRQKIQAKGGKNFEGAAYEINKILNYIFQDYRDNHDSDEIEIDADERGWKKCGGFIKQYFQTAEKKELFSKCVKNAKAVNCRRSFSVKEDPDTKKTFRYIDYDIRKVIEAIKKSPEVLKQFPKLAEVFTPDGQIKMEFLYNDTITTSPAGRELCNYIMNEIPEQMVVDAINSGKVSAKQTAQLLENFVQVPHENALTLRDLKKTDLDTFNETRSRCRIKDDINQVYNYYFAECAQQLMKFSTILEAAKHKFELFDDEYTNSYYKFFVEYYYVEMLENIEKPNVDLINRQMIQYQNSNNNILMHLAKYTISYLNHKTSTYGYQQNVGSGMGQRAVSDELNDMLNDTYNVNTPQKDNNTDKKIAA